MTVQPQVDILAHHMLLLAIPAFLPAVAVVGVVIWIAVRDRRTDSDEPLARRAEDGDERSREEQKANARTAERDGNQE